MQKKGLICFWKTQLCLHPQRELNRCLDVSILHGLTDGGMVAQTELVNKRLTEEEGVPMKIHIQGQTIVPSYTRPYNFHVVHT